MKQLKTSIAVMVFLLCQLFAPIFGQWYEQQTGIIPITFYAFGFLASCGLMALIIYKIWND